MKTCKKCSSEKPLESFSKCVRSHDGLQSKCKFCANEDAKIYYAKNRDSVLKKHAENKDENNKKSREYKDKNRDSLRLYSEQYRAENRDLLRRKQVEYASKNRYLVNASTAAWRKANPWRGRIYRHNRSDRMASVGGTLSYGLSEKLLYLQRGKCACCKTKLVKYHMDHIVPVSKGGANSDENIQLLCPPCNLRKHAKHPVDFMQQEGFLL